MYSLYPEIEPYNHGTLQVSSLHSIYYEEVGNPSGVPVIFLHGGPGGGITPDYRRFFDPQFYRVILFDQRGAGKSTPHAELKENTTWDLVSDIEKLRLYLNIEQWFVFGGSWGSTLALSYATTHPTPVKGLALRGIFLCRKKEIQWFYQEGASSLFPDEWEKYLAVIPESEHHDLVTAYYKKLTSENSEERLKAALAWSKWEAATSKLLPDAKSIEAFEDPHLALAFARIECHYFINNAFMESDAFLLNSIEKIRHLPCKIIQGRYDVVCPTTSAWDLHRAWPEAEIHIIPNAGHSAFESPIAEKLVWTMEEFKSLE